MQGSRVWMVFRHGVSCAKAGAVTLGSQSSSGLHFHTAMSCIILTSLSALTIFPWNLIFLFCWGPFVNSSTVQHLIPEPETTVMRCILLLQQYHSWLPGAQRPQEEVVQYQSFLRILGLGSFLLSLVLISHLHWAPFLLGFWKCYLPFSETRGPFIFLILLVI